MSANTGLILDIERLSTRNGPGIRSTVFFKGCPLNCVWCHNPESINIVPEILYDPAKCSGCGRCAAACPRQCRGEKGGFARTRCNACGKCVDVCGSQALELAGQYMEMPELLAELEKDRVFFEASGGGITISGGEPLQQFDFLAALLKEAKIRKFHIALDTCGLADFSDLAAIAPAVDVFRYDIKAVDPVRHLELTGADNSLILENLFRLDRLGKAITLCCPLIPGVNDDAAHLAAIAALAERCACVDAIELHPYHPLGLDKRRRLGMPCGEQSKRWAGPEEIEHWRQVISGRTRVPVTGV